MIRAEVCSVLWETSEGTRREWMVWMHEDDLPQEMVAQRPTWKAAMEAAWWHIGVYLEQRLA